MKLTSLSRKAYDQLMSPLLPQKRGKNRWVYYPSWGVRYLKCFFYRLVFFLKDSPHQWKNNQYLYKNLQNSIKNLQTKPDFDAEAIDQIKRISKIWERLQQRVADTNSLGVEIGTLCEKHSVPIANLPLSLNLPTHPITKIPIMSIQAKKKNSNVSNGWRTSFVKNTMNFVSSTTGISYEQIVKMVIANAGTCTNKEVCQRLQEQKASFYKQCNTLLSLVKTFPEKKEKLEATAIFTTQKDLLAFANKDIQGEVSNQNWIVHLVGRYSYYEDVLETARKMGEEVKANVLLFNYKSVGENQAAVPDTIDEVIENVIEGVEILLDRGVPKEKIVVMGHSLGGGISTIVASKIPGTANVNVCSFSKLSSVGRNFFPKLGPALSFGSWATDWEIDAATAWEKIQNKFIVVDKKDPVIPYNQSLYKVVKNNIRRAPELTKEDQSTPNKATPPGIKLDQKNHNFPLNGPGWTQMTQFIKNFFSK